MATGAREDDRIRIGASWYPEMWPREEWPKDVARMRELGYNMVRLFEFAWHRFEPREGEYDFAWALEVMDLCHGAGIAVMAGTPTAAPPAWLTDRYPEVLLTDAKGRRAGHGGRKHYNPNSAKYRELSNRIAAKMAEAFAGHPALHSWQIDNEMGSADYGPESRERFQAWLRARYGNVDALNRAWGLEFWSQAYDDFAQIPMVTASVGSVEIPERHHPSLIMAIARFHNEGWEAFIGGQCAAIRKRSRHPISTNMTPGFAMDWFRHNRLLDRVGHSLYKDVVHYPWNIMYFDRMRAEKAAPDGSYLPYWLLETAPSWSAGGRIWNIHHDGAGIRALSWASTALGGSMLLYWQWREHWAGQEMLHGTLVTATGKWRPNREAMARICAEHYRHQEWLLSHPPAPARVGLLMSNENAWGFSIDPMDDDMRYDVRWRDDFHLPLLRSHIWRDVIDETRDLSQYQVLIVPLMPMVPEDFRRRLEDWVRAGGRLLLGPLVGFRTPEFTAYTEPGREFGGLEDLMGATSSLRFSVHWVEDKVRVEFAGGESIHPRTWGEGFAPAAGRPLAWYRGGYGDGQVAVVENQYGAGTVITVGTRTDEATYLRLVRDLMARQGLAPEAEGDPEVLVVPRAGTDGALAGYAVVNLAEEPKRVRLTRAGEDMLQGGKVAGDLELEPLGVRLVSVTTG